MTHRYKITFWIIILSMLLGMVINNFISHLNKLSFSIKQPLWVKIIFDIDFIMILLLVLLYLVNKEDN